MVIKYYIIGWMLYVQLYHRDVTRELQELTQASGGLRLMDLKMLCFIISALLLLLSYCFFTRIKTEGVEKAQISDLSD